jgi:excisionase family DNA binding protein
VSESSDRLETPKQLAARVGLTERQIRHLVQTRQLEYVEIGKRILLPVTAFANFLEARKVRPWHAETKDRDSVGSPSARVSTSVGPSTVAAASAALARQTAHKLKSSSRNGSSSEAAAPAQVIPLKSS